MSSRSAGCRVAPQAAIAAGEAFSRHGKLDVVPKVHGRSRCDAAMLGAASGRQQNSPRKPTKKVSKTMEL